MFAHLSMGVACSRDLSLRCLDVVVSHQLAPAETWRDCRERAVGREDECERLFVRHVCCHCSWY